MNALHILRLACPAMMWLLLAWLAWGSFLVGLGLGVLRVLGSRTISADRLILAFWVGVAAAIGFLQIWHLVLPVSSATVVVIVTLGIAGLAWHGRALRHWARADDSLGRLIPLLLLTIIAIWLSDRALIGTDLYDSGLYHLQVVRWEQTYAIVPGLANLHARFSFNNANLLLVALMGGGKWAGRGGQVLEALLVLGLWAPGILAMVRIFRASRMPLPPRSTDVFTMFLLPAAYLMSVNYVNPELASPSTDLPAAAVTLFSACLLFGYLDEVRREDRRPGVSVELPALAALLAMAVCMKLSAAAFALTAAGVAAVTWGRRREGVGVHEWLTPGLALLAAALLLVPWIGRGIILSGYPFFPSHILGASVPWRMPVELVDQTRAAIETFTRAPGSPPATWLTRLWREATLPRPLAMSYSLLYAAVLILAAVVIVMRRRTRSGELTHEPAASAGWWVLLPWGAAVLAWLATAPAWRFAWHLFFIPPAVATAMLVRICAAYGSDRVPLAACLPVPSTPVDQNTSGLSGDQSTGRQAASGTRPSNRQGTTRRHFRRLALPWLLLALMVFRVHDLLFFTPLITPPGIDHGLEPLRTAALQTRFTRSGLKVYVPAKGDQCWDGPLPCTPEWRPDLQLRETNDPSAGFVIDGESQAEMRASNDQDHQTSRPSRR